MCFWDCALVTVGMVGDEKRIEIAIWVIVSLVKDTLAC